MYCSGVSRCRMRPPPYFSISRDMSWQSSCSCCRSCCCAHWGSCEGSAACGIGLDLDPLLRFYGLRQSSLLHRSAPRSVVLAGGTGYSCPYPVYGFDWEVWDGCGGPTLGGRREGRNGSRRRRSKCTASDKERGVGRFSRLERVEAVISLLSEEVDEESLGLREGEGGLGDKVLTRKKRNDGGVHSKGRTTCLGAGRSKKEAPYGFESIHINAADCDDREEKARGREVLSIRENRGTRREGSICSSYHCARSSGGYEDGAEEIKCDEFSAEASSRYDEDSRKAVERKMNKELLEDYEQQEESKKRREVTQQRRESESSFIDWDRRKKSEKKLSEVSIDEVESSMTSVQEQSTKLRTAGREDVGPSSFQNQCHGGERISSLGMTIETRTGNLHDHKETTVRIVGRPTEIGKETSEASEVCSFCRGDFKFLSQSDNQQPTRRKEGVAVSGDLVGDKINEQDGMKAVTAEREKFIRNPHVLTVEMDIGGTYSEMTTDFSRSSEARADSNMVGEKREQRFTTNEVVHEEKQSLKSKQSSENEESHHDIRRVSIPQLDNSMYSQKELQFASSLTGNQIIRSPQRHPEIQTGGLSSEKSAAVINQSLIHATETKSFASYQTISNETTFNENSFMSVVVLSGETEERNNQTGGTVASIESKTGQDSVDLLSSIDDTRSKTSTSQDLDLVYQSGAPKTGTRGRTPSQSSLITPPSQLVRRGSSPCGRTDENTSHEGYYMHTSHSSSTQVGAGSPGLHNRFDTGEVKDGRDDHSVMFTTDGHTLESAIRSDEASRKFLGEFMEQTEHGANSDIHGSGSTFNDQGFDGKNSFCKIVSEGSQGEAQDKRNVTEDPGMKCSSDDIWHDTDTSIQEIPKPESLEGHIASGNAIARRSGRTLWRIIGDIIRLRRGNSHSLSRSDGKISSDMSVCTDTWFSGHEANESIDSSAKSGSNNKPLEAAATLLQPVCTLTGDRVDTQVVVRERKPKAEISPPFETKSDSSSELPSTTSFYKDFTWNKDIVVSPPVTIGLSGSLLPLPERGMATSLGVTSSSSKASVYESESLQGPDEGSDMPAKVIAQDGKNGELKQRKMFHRKQQVLRERFDEWEEVYELEREQRQIDEMFMREALLEAKKAGDSWEVPVGAVLVQHGKIIARGCNLVEELRDSTAHAEILCIREASKLLKSWSLAETTLYVTLEPCTMCAGAILQARVDNLVWGAPNKLLGADGSYIRLFPFEEGESGSQVTDKAAAPVHPFHPKMTIRRGVLASECAEAMQQFFQLRRRKKGKKDEQSPSTSGLPISPHRMKLLDKMHNILHLMFCI